MNNIISLNENRVYQANVLIQASYKLTLDEKRVIIAALSVCDQRKKIPDEITIRAQDYSDLFDVSINNAYIQLKDASTSLFERDILVKSSDKEGNLIKTHMRWIYNKADYDAGSGAIRIRFSPDVKPYLCELEKEFSSYKIRHVKALKRFYSIRLYEIINQHIEDGIRWFLLDDFRELLKIQNKYKNFSDIAKWVIRPALKELNEKTNFKVDYETEKKGRTVYKITFYFKDKDKKELGFE